MKSLIEIKHAILTYFQQENVFIISKHLALLNIDGDNAELKAALVKQGMSDFEKVDMVRSFTYKADGVLEDGYVLTKPLGLYDQTVTIGYRTALHLADVVDAYCSKMGVKDEQCDPTQIKERDIQKVALILDRLLQNDKTSQV